MYIPAAFAITDQVKIAEVINANSFGLLISTDHGAPFASHLPFIFQPHEGPHGKLIGHMAKANRHWQLFRENEETLVIFSGPHAYISPSYYTTDVAVPTWNYVTVHAYGKPRLLQTEAELRHVLDETVQQHEAGQPNPWSTSRLPAEMESKLHQAIVGFEIEITRLEAKFKLGQNRSPEDQSKMLQSLKSSSDPDSQNLAAFIEGNAP